MDNLIVYLIVIVFFMILLLTPVIIKIIQTYRLGAKIPFERTIFMCLRKTLKEDLIKAIALSQKSNKNIDLNTLEAHFLAGGSPLKCIEAIEFAKQQGINLDFSLVAAANLADKDLFQAIEKTNEILKLNFSKNRDDKSKLKEISFEFMGEYKVSFGSACFGAIDENKLIKEAKEKIHKFLENSDTIEFIKMNKIISEVILDNKYWESKGLKMINQRLKTTGVNKS